MYLDFDLDQLIASLTAKSEMMAFVLDGRLDPLAELFGLVQREACPTGKGRAVPGPPAGLKPVQRGNRTRPRTDRPSAPAARSGSETLQLRQAHALVDRLYKGNIRLAELITKFLTD